MSVRTDGDRETSAELPLFRGVVEVLRLIGRLYRRPKLGDRARHGEDDGSGKGLPMLCLIRPAEHRALLPAISERLKSAEKNRVPHAFVSRPETGPDTDHDAPLQPDVRQIRDLLAEIAEKLGDAWNARSGRIRFHRFGLAVWLMQQDLSRVEPPRREAELRRRLWRRDPAQRISDLINSSGSGAPDTVWPVIKAISVLPWVWSRLRTTGRLPGLGREYRWFRRQPYLAPEVPGTFLGFAERLTRGEWPQEAPDQVVRFLTNALLEDLRRAYGRFPWRLRGERRMSYAVVLLDNVTRANGGYDLLKLINDVRNETGRFDPLLVISASRKVPPHAVEPTVGDVRDAVYDADEAEEGHRAWRRRLVGDRRRRNEMTWYLPISTYTGPTSEDERYRIGRALAAEGPYRLPRPPWWSRRAVPLGLGLALVAGGAVGYSVYGDQHCGVPLSRPWAWFTGDGELETQGRECVGVTGGAFVRAFLNPAAQAPAEVYEGLRRTGGILQQQNDEAVRTSAEDRRPLVTLAYLGDFSGNSSVELTAEHETLAGIAVAQRDQNSRENSTAPVVRILVANGGGNMRNASHVVRTYLSGVAADPGEGLVGVVGLNHSRAETVAAIEEVTRLGLPIVASTLSYDDLSDFSPLYFQVSPQNRQEAQQAAGYFRGRGDGEVGVYRDPNDAYSANLGADVVDELGRTGRATRWLAPAKPYDAGREACGDEEVYYAGRATSFNDFLRGVSDGCGGGPLPDILAGDDVTQHVADRVRRERFLGIPYAYQSFAVGPTRPDPDDAANNLKPNEYTFYCSLNRFLAGDGGQDKCPPRRGDLSLDGHAALAHDATRVLLNAAERLQTTVAGPERATAPVPITPGAVWRELNSVRTPEQQESLVTGVIDFGSDTTKRVPLNKGIWVLRVRGGEVEPLSER